VSLSKQVRAYIENRISQDNLDLQICDLGALQIDSKGKPKCLYKPIQKLVDTKNWTEETCFFCKKVRLEMAQLENITGKEPKPKNHAPLVIIAKKLQTYKAKAESQERDIHFYKKELGLKGSNLSKVEELEKEVSSIIKQNEALKEEKNSQLATLEAEKKSIKEEKNSLKEQLKKMLYIDINCPIENKKVPLIKCLKTCQKWSDCPFYGSLVFS
jgi:hypothetical protein